MVVGSGVSDRGRGKAGRAAGAKGFRGGKEALGHFGVLGRRLALGFGHFLFFN